MNKQKAWLLGWLVSDGYVRKEGNELAFTAPHEVILKIKKIIGTKNKVRRWENYSRFSISDKKLKREIINLGYFPKKQFPSIPIPVYSHFIRGFFEGDGCVYQTKVRNKVGKKYYTTRANFVSGSKDILDRIQNILLLEGIKSNFTFNKTGKGTFVLNISNRSLGQFFNYLYKDADPSIWYSVKNHKFLERRSVGSG